MVYKFYTSRKDQNAITGAYDQGGCNYCGQISSPIGEDEELTVSLTNIAATISILDIIEIARYCRDQLRPAWYAGRPIWARIEIQGRVWADVMFLDRGPAIWGLTAQERAEIEKTGHDAQFIYPWLYDTQSEIFGVARIIRATDDQGREWQTIKMPGEPLAGLHWKMTD